MNGTATVRCKSKSSIFVLVGRVESSKPAKALATSRWVSQSLDPPYEIPRTSGEFRYGFAEAGAPEPGITPDAGIFDRSRSRGRSGRVQVNQTAATSASES